MTMLLSVVAIVAASLFTGAAGYITFVEHPARLMLNDEPLLAQWKPSYARGLPLQSGLAVPAGGFGLAAWTIHRDWQWAAGSVAILANWPFLSGQPNAVGQSPWSDEDSEDEAAAAQANEDAKPASATSSNCAGGNISGRSKAAPSSARRGKCCAARSIGNARAR